jgi:hypothetical protein
MAAISMIRLAADLASCPIRIAHGIACRGVLPPFPARREAL